MKRNLAIGLFWLAGLWWMAVPGSAAESPSWQKVWEETLARAYREGQVTVYGRPAKVYRDVFDAFEQDYPKIKLTYVPGGGQNAQRIFAERRAGKYIADIALVGAATGNVLFAGNVLAPIPPVLILPENRDSLWFRKRPLYADPAEEHVFIMTGNVDLAIGAYNVKLVDPKEIRSYWDLLNPKWKGKIVLYDPRERGHMGNWKAMYHHPRLGKEFIWRLLSEMDVTLSRDQRQMLNWVATGKFYLAVPVNETDVVEANNQGLSLDVVDAPPQEGYLQTASGHLVLFNRAPHPNAAKVMVNWLLSRRGQSEWQKKTGYNSLRTDIPKDTVYDAKSIPKEEVEYLVASSYRYADVGALLELIRGALEKKGRKP